MDALEYRVMEKRTHSHNSIVASPALITANIEFNVRFSIVHNDIRVKGTEKEN